MIPPSAKVLVTHIRCDTISISSTVINVAMCCYGIAMVLLHVAMVCSSHLCALILVEGFYLEIICNYQENSEEEDRYVVFL